MVEDSAVLPVKYADEGGSVVEYVDGDSEMKKVDC